MFLLQHGITPLIFAVKQRNLEIVRTLVENGRAHVQLAEPVSVIIAKWVTTEHTDCVCMNDND